MLLLRVLPHHPVRHKHQTVVAARLYGDVATQPLKFTDEETDPNFYFQPHFAFLCRENLTCHICHLL